MAVMGDPRRKLRKFGLTVGTAFLVIGGVSRLRGHDSVSMGLWVAGGLLLAFGLVLPQALGPVERGWMALAMILSWINTRIILTLLFFVAFTPIGMARRLFKDSLDRKFRDGRSTYWHPRERKPAGRVQYERQF
jgi:hypothetical protein